MIFNIVVEDLGGADEGVFVGWLKTPGDVVVRGEAIAEVMTDKVNMEVISPADGLFEPTQLEEETRVTIGQVIGHIKGASE